MKKVFNLLVFLIIPLLVKSRETTTEVSTSTEAAEHELPKLQDKIRDQEKIIENLKDAISQKELQVDQQIDLTNSYKDNIASNRALIRTLRALVKSKEFEVKERNTEINILQARQRENDLNVAKIKELDLKFAECKTMSIAQICNGKTDDVHEIKVPDMDPFSLPCRMDDEGSVWTVIQRRVDGSEDFNRTWVEYKEGFGNLSSEFFIGLEKLHLLTNSQPHELYIHLEDFQNETRYAQYSHFLIGNETESYALKMLGDYSGDANDALTPHLNMKFATPDRDNKGKCAKSYESGWWYNDCGLSNLNERYTSENNEKAQFIFWCKWHTKPLQYTEMMIRPAIY